MLHELLDALDGDNGITEDIWFKIVRVVGATDPSVQGVNCFGGRYYITDMKRDRLFYELPLHYPQTQTQLALPPHLELSHPIDIRCSRCKGPFHPASGHAFSAIIVACGPCYGRFAAWQMQKYGWHPIEREQLKKINKKKNKNAKKAQRAAKALEKQAAREAIEREKLYGVPRAVQNSMSHEVIDSLSRS